MRHLRVFFDTYFVPCSTTEMPTSFSKKLSSNVPRPAAHSHFLFDRSICLVSDTTNANAAVATRRLSPLEKGNMSSSADGEEESVESPKPEKMASLSSSTPVLKNGATWGESTKGSPRELEKSKSDGHSVRKTSDSSSKNAFQTTTEKGIKMTTESVSKGLKFGTTLGKNVGQFTARKVATVARTGSNQIRGTSKKSIDTSTEFFLSSFKRKTTRSGKGRKDDESTVMERNYRGDGLVYVDNNSSNDNVGDGTSIGGDQSTLDGWNSRLIGNKSGFGDVFILSDNVIMWVIVLSIFLDQVSRHCDEILTDQKCSFGVAMALSLVSFAVGLEINNVEFFETLKAYISGIPVHDKVHASYDTMSTVSELTMEKTAKRRRSSILGSVFSFGSIYNFPMKPTYRTVLTTKKSTLQKQNSDLKRSPIMKNLQKLGRRNLALIDLTRYTSKEGDGPGKVTEQGKESSQEASSPSSDKMKTDFSIGSGQGPGLMAGDDLISHVSQPICELRGRDIFRTEEADPEIIDHPFLLRNGLKDCPTFMINILTVFGNIVVYFKLPDWVQDFDESLVENDDDFPSVKALKRFLSGDDEYRKKVLKVMPELVEGPTTVRLLAPKNRAFPLELSPLISTTYRQVQATESEFPCMSVTVDFLTNSTIRGFVGIYRRNLHRLVVDFACVIDAGDNEPSAVIGLWRMNKLNYDDQPKLPDRYTNVGTQVEDADSVRASILMEKWKKTPVVEPVC